jgi:hypothetical protein
MKNRVPGAGDSEISTDQSASVAKFYNLTVFGKMFFKRGLMPETNAGGPFRCRYFLQNCAAPSALKTTIMF